MIDRPEGRWLVRHLGTRGEARPAGWSLHRTGMRPDMRVGFLVFSYTQELTVWKPYCMLEYLYLVGFLQTVELKKMLLRRRNGR
jgi:hypothetical protein